MKNSCYKSAVTLLLLSFSSTRSRGRTKLHTETKSAKNASFTLIFLKIIYSLLRKFEIDKQIRNLYRGRCPSSPILTKALHRTSILLRNRWKAGLYDCTIRHNLISLVYFLSLVTNGQTLINYTYKFDQEFLSSKLFTAPLFLEPRGFFVNKPVNYDNKYSYTSEAQ